MIQSSAPGKLIISGEYAVLDDAPCLVAAIDRRATCWLEEADHWQFNSRGFNSPSSSFAVAEFATTEPKSGDPGHLPWHSLQALDQHMSPAKLETNTEAFYLHNTKLGFGSSAALSVAISGALAHQTNLILDFATALQAHRSFQGAQGSGADVAAAFYGGCLRYQSEHATPHTLPTDLHWMCVWTGKPADTKDHIRHFERWLANGNTATFENLKIASDNIFNSNKFLPALHNYVETLVEFDQSSQLGIYTETHQQLTHMARQFDLVYKPSGAGGGDLGIYVAQESDQVEAFSRQISDLGLQPLAMTFAEQGLMIEA